MIAEATAAYPRFAAALVNDAPLGELVGWVAEGVEEFDAMALARRLEFLAYLVGQAAGAQPSPAAKTAALARVLAQEEGYTADDELAEDPASCLLHRVIDRRQGCPAAIAAIYLAVAERLGWDLVPIELREQFVVGLPSAAGWYLIGPSRAGRRLAFEDCVELLLERYDFPREIVALYLLERLDTPASRDDLLIRLLRDLSSGLIMQHDFAGARAALEKALLVRPWLCLELRNLGVIYQCLGEHDRAVGCWRSYLAAVPDAPDRSGVESAIERLERRTEQ